MLIPYLYDRISVKEIENNDEVFFICDDDMGKKYIIDRKGKKEEYIEVCDLLKKYNL